MKFLVSNFNFFSFNFLKFANASLPFSDTVSITRIIEPTNFTVILTVLRHYIQVLIFTFLVLKIIYSQFQYYGNGIFLKLYRMSWRYKDLHWHTKWSFTFFITHKILQKFKSFKTKRHSFYVIVRNTYVEQVQITW